MFVTSILHVLQIMEAKFSIATPNLAHLSPGDYEAVYEPAEDSFLLLDALEIELENMLTSEPLICVEVGGGSGIISTALSLKLPNSFFLVTDINEKACRAIQRTAYHNQTSLEVVRSRTLGGLSERLCHNVDIVLCNPPYVRTPEDEADTCDITASWAGGRRGLNVTLEVIDSLDSLLTERGAAYIVLEKCNKPELVQKYAE